MQLVTERAVALGVHDDRAMPELDQAPGDPRLRDRLPGPGGAEHQRVPAAATADGDVHGAAAVIATDHEPALGDHASAADAALGRGRHATR